MLSTYRLLIPCIASLAVAVGCSPAPQTPETTSVPATESSNAYVVHEEPADAIPVGKARASVNDGQTITLVGTIGGSRQPFVDGLAAFTIVDPSIPSCADEEGCPTPWDYCCTQDQVKDNVATVKIVDGQGAPVAQDAKALLGVQELSTVVVSGKASRDAEGNLSLAANQVFIRQ